MQQPLRSVAEIREAFLSYFESHGHTRVASSALIPQNDPTLLFTNAGMVQFKDVFTGKDKRPYSRATTAQKCVRAGGKHNDLENVGFTARHHTFFEMLGNFSFGDYFKKEAIHYAWEFTTQVLKLPKDRLYVTVYEKDDEAAEIWAKQENVPLERIYRFGEKDNFWQMGDTGPCGPCTELFIDRGAQHGCGKPTCKMGCDCDRYMEFWNLVFMQYDRSADGTLTPLPRPSVDTGAGLERLASILQEVPTNYDIDGFQTILRASESLFTEPYRPGRESAFSYRVIADHARAAAFLIADGVLPSNEGRGYVLRRIIRRAVRHGKKLGRSTPFLHTVAGFAVQQMAPAYPELQQQAILIDKALKSEEEQFLRTLERGLVLLDEALARRPKTLPGETAFLLYDTYGFPLDLTRVICAERGLAVDEEGFSVAMERQRDESRKNWKGSGDDAVAGDYFQAAQELRSQMPSGATEFVGYEHLSASGKILAIWEVSGTGKERTRRRVTEVPTSQDSKSGFEIVLDRTCFYPEGGGQVADQGEVWSEDKAFHAHVRHVQRPVPEIVVLTLTVATQSTRPLRLGEVLHQATSARLRAMTARNHTATHMLHWALRKVLGNHVKQSGSLVTPELLRFDFSHFQALTENEIAQVEALVTHEILENAPVSQAEMSKDAALAKGAIAFFGDKYGERVRVVSVGEFSTELCGGTHVAHASELGGFVVASESGIAAGVRRIIAYTSVGAFEYWRARTMEIKTAQALLRTSSTEEVVPRVQKLLESEKDLSKQIERLEAQNAARWVEEVWAKSVPLASGGQGLATEVPLDPAPGKRLRELAETLKQRHPDAVLVLAMCEPAASKLHLVTAVGPQAPATWSAQEVLKPLLPLFQGKGGGKRDFAQAAGTVHTAGAQVVSAALAALGGKQP